MSKDTVCTYTPILFFFQDLVREIRDAAQLREETLLSRLRLMMADGGVLRLTGSNAIEKEACIHLWDCLIS